MRIERLAVHLKFTRSSCIFSSFTIWHPVFMFTHQSQGLLRSSNCVSFFCLCGGNVLHRCHFLGLKCAFKMIEVVWSCILACTQLCRPLFLSFCELTPYFSCWLLIWILTFKKGLMSKKADENASVEKNSKKSSTGKKDVEADKKRKTKAKEQFLKQTFANVLWKLKWFKQLHANSVTRRATPS